MITFHLHKEFGGLRFSAGGRNYEFDGIELAVEEEADAKRVRQFALENPSWGIEQDAAEPTPEPDPTTPATPTEPTEPTTPTEPDPTPTEPATEPTPDPTPEPEAPEKTLNRMNLAELVAVATSRGVAIPDGATKAQIRAALGE